MIDSQNRLHISCMDLLITIRNKLQGLHMTCTRRGFIRRNAMLDPETGICNVACHMRAKQNWVCTLRTQHGHIDTMVSDD